METFTSRIKKTWEFIDQAHIWRRVASIPTWLARWDAEGRYIKY